MVEFYFLKFMKTINTVQVSKKLSLSCLCLEHDKKSTCEVYLRQIGRWTDEIENEKVEELTKWLKKEGLKMNKIICQ